MTPPPVPERPSASPSTPSPSPTPSVAVAVVLVSGVSGAGKTTLSRALAAALGWRFADADDFHPPANIAKMRAGLPLDDTDRAPWLRALRAEIDQHLAQGAPLVLACSALKQAYRATLLGGDRVGGDPGRVRLVFLAASRELLAARLATRAGHYMPPSLLDSQLATLEPPTDALHVDAALPTEAQVAAVRAALGLRPARHPA